MDRQTRFLIVLLIAAALASIGEARVNRTEKATPYGSSCVNPSDCDFGESDCVEGRCRCNARHVYDKQSATCVTQYSLLENLDERMNRLEATTREQNLTIKILNAEITALKENVIEQSDTTISKYNDLKTTVAGHTKCTMARVAFVAGRSSSQPSEVSSPHTVIYDSVKLSIGGGYNATTGTFTCPVAGLYEFTLHFTTAGSDKWACLNIFGKGSYVSTAEGKDKDYYVSHSASASLLLAVGDTVMVKPCTNGPSSYLLAGSASPYHNVFRGQLLSADTCL